MQITQQQLTLFAAEVLRTSAAELDAFSLRIKKDGPGEELADHWTLAAFLAGVHQSSKMLYASADEIEKGDTDEHH